jgi:hypothetical protein
MRLAAVFSGLDRGYSRRTLGILPKLQRELGIEVASYSGYVNWEFFLPKAEIRDVLDSITLVYQFALDNLPDSAAKYIAAEAARIFAEENVRYRLDSQCGVHLAIDVEFECSMASVVAGLGNARYIAARNAFDAAQAAQDRAEPDFKEALRNVFLAVEVVFKAMFGTSGLSRHFIDKNLKPLMADLYSDSPTATKVAELYVDGLSDWVSGLHEYRHGQPADTLPQPPLDLSVALMSSGVAYLRWLIGIDQTLQAKAK